MLAIEEMSYVVVVYRNQLGEFYVFWRHPQLSARD
jgi:hypothetical protein